VYLPVPPVNANDDEHHPHGAIPIPPGRAPEARFNGHPMYPEARLRLYINSHPDTFDAIEQLCATFSAAGFGQRSTVIAFFGERLRIAENRIVQEASEVDQNVDELADY
jgi:hypothetical protein